MELSYWQSRWNKGNIGFHMEGGYPGLQKHWTELNISPNAVVLVPLCGKSIDMVWLSQRVKTVVGVEVSEKAVLEFFDEHNLDPVSETFAGFTIYKAENIELWCGDFLKFPSHKHPAFELIYDKAALVALPEKMRSGYAQKIIELTSQSTKILLHHFIYNQQEMNGPPFSVGDGEIDELFGNHCNIKTLEENTLEIEAYHKFKKRGLNSYLNEKLLFLTKKTPRNKI